MSFSLDKKENYITFSHTLNRDFNPYLIDFNVILLNVIFMNVINNYLS
jgi:hypothetical protein